MPLWRFDNIFRALKANSSSPFSFYLVGGLAVRDYLGDTASQTGVPLPECTIGTVRFEADSAPDGTEVTLHNHTQGTSAAHTITSASESFDADLDFDADDELGIEVTAVGSTSGADVNVVAELNQDIPEIPTR